MRFFATISGPSRLKLSLASSYASIGWFGYLVLMAPKFYFFQTPSISNLNWARNLLYVLINQMFCSFQKTYVPIFVSHSPGTEVCNAIHESSLVKPYES